MSTKMTSIFILIILLSITTSLFSQRGRNFDYPSNLKPVYSNLEYANISKAQVLDLFLPESSGPFPLVVNIHGGAFRMGSKEMLDAPIAHELLKAGIAVASINYRLSGEATFSAAVQDAKAAVRFLRANSKEYNLNPEKFLVFGQSAGGNIASTLGTCGDDIIVFDAPELGNAGVSSRVQGVIDWFGPTDFLQMDEQAKAQGCPERSQTHSAANSPESEYLGGDIDELPELVKKSNPITYVSKDDPPFLLQKGKNDCVVPFRQTKLLYDSLQKNGVEVEYDILDAGHGDMGSDTPVFLSDKNIQRILGFVKKTLTQSQWLTK